MPNKGAKSCSYPRCSGRVKYYGAGHLCEKHRKQKQREKAKRDVAKNPEVKKFYDSKVWRSLRMEQLVEEPLCRECRKKGRLKAAEMVDHIVPVRVDWERRLDKTNLQSLCNRCHAVKRGRESRLYDDTGTIPDVI